jgi:hypothetical protein
MSVKFYLLFIWDMFDCQEPKLLLPNFQNKNIRTEKYYVLLVASFYAVCALAQWRAALRPVTNLRVVYNINKSLIC